MELKELRKLPMPKLRDVAKQETDLKNVIALEKEELIKAIAAAQGIPYDETHKDLNAIHAVKQDIRALQKQRAELLTSSGDRKKIKKLRRKVKLMKRVTRHLAHDAKLAAAAAAAKPAAPAAPAQTPPAAS
jgi:flagellar motility protein MotE (MotC chaperone)